MKNLSKSFNRYCRLIVGESGDESYLDLSDLRIRFEIEKSSIGYPNKAKITVYNLSNDSRQRLRTEFDQVILEAGYEDNFGIIFKGEIFNVFNRRDQPDYITEIYASDGGKSYRGSWSNRSYGNGVEVSKIVEDLRNDMGLDVGRINADLTGKKMLGCNITGDTALEMDKLADSYGFSWSIQTGKLYVIGNDRKVNTKPEFEINAESGLIGSPVLTTLGINLKTLLNWRLIPSEQIKVVSLSQPVNFKNLNLFNRDNVYPQTQGTGEYIARKFTHTGDTRGNEWYTDIEGYFPADSLGGE